MLLTAALMFAGCERRADGVEIATTDGKEQPIPEKFDIDSYLAKAMTHLKAQTRRHQDAWGIADARWDADQETGILTWTLGDGRKAEAPFQIVGTYSAASGTFLWAWDHPSVVESLTADAHRLKAFGEENGIEFLQWRKLDCTEESAWELAALANLLCEREGVYRGPSGASRVFMTFGKVTLSPTVQGQIEDEDSP